MIVWSFSIPYGRLPELRSTISRYPQLEHRQLRSASHDKIGVDLNWHVEEDDHHLYRRALNEILLLVGPGHFEAVNCPDDHGTQQGWFGGIRKSISRIFG